VVQRIGGFEEDVKNRIMGEWIKWREASGICVTKKVRLKGRFYKASHVVWIRMLGSGQ